jgi:hypothetical protein
VDQVETGRCSTTLFLGVDLGQDPLLAPLSLDAGGSNMAGSAATFLHEPLFAKTG